MVRFNKRPQGKLKQRGLLPTGPGRGTQHALQGQAGKSRQGVGRVAGPGPHAFLEWVGGVLWGSVAKARLVGLNQKSRVLVSFLGVLPKGHTRGRP